MSARLHRTRCVVVRTSDAEAGIKGEEAVVPLLLDLETVVAARPVWDFDTDSYVPERTTIDLDTEVGLALAEDFDTFAAAWEAYRREADALTRIRN